jgi:uroporphyrinogen III methyltransferase/synthase
LGAEVLLQPAIAIEPPEDWQQLDACLARLAEFRWIVFSSANGVRMFLQRLLATGRDMRSLGAVKLAAIGPGTAEELTHYHLQADIIPTTEFRAEALAAALAEQVRGQRCLLVRASRGREVLAQELTAAGGVVEQVIAYRSLDLPSPAPLILEQMRAGKIDWVTVTSSAIARSLTAMFGPALQRTKLASISPITSATLRELGYSIAAEAEEYTMPGVVQALLRANENTQ